MRRLSMVVSTWFIVATLALADHIAFLYALDADLVALKANTTTLGQPVLIGSRSIQRLAAGPHTIYAVKMRPGPIESALSVQALLTKYPCDWAISVGPAGALSDNLAPGTWCRVDRIVAWQSPSAVASYDAPQESCTWLCDTTHFSAAESPAPLDAASIVSLASGDAFIASSGQRDRIRAATAADIVDMNCLGMAACCKDHHVPLIVWKVISDGADELASGTFRSFVDAYDGAGGRAVASMIQQLPPRSDDPSSYSAIKTFLDVPTGETLP